MSDYRYDTNGKCASCYGTESVLCLGVPIGVRCPDCDMFGLSRLPPPVPTADLDIMRRELDPEHPGRPEAGR